MTTSVLYSDNVQYDGGKELWNDKQSHIVYKILHTTLLKKSNLKIELQMTCTFKTKVQFLKTFLGEKKSTSLMRQLKSQNNKLYNKNSFNQKRRNEEKQAKFHRHLRQIKTRFSAKLIVHSLFPTRR